MKIEQFEDKSLAQYSYAIVSTDTNEIILIDPSRDPHPYYELAAKDNSKITGVIETHPHADFISSHLQIHHEKGATIYTSKLLNADYPHKTFDEGDIITVGKIKLSALNTPGHSPDSVSVLLEHENKEKALFTGDTLFIGDCGRPDLRETSGKLTAQRGQLARQMYRSLRSKILPLPDHIEIYPGHGAGTLCGKSLTDANKSTLYAERYSNWSLQKMSEDEFVRRLLEDQPVIPKYFSYDVELNKKGAEHFSEGINRVSIASPIVCTDCSDSLDKTNVVIDTRSSEIFKKGHLENSVNLMFGKKFETWLGSIINPREMFYLVSDSEETLKELISRTAKIGYETFIKLAFILKKGSKQSPNIDVELLGKTPEAFTIIDIRNPSEVKENRPFKNSINIPLPELRERVKEIPFDRPIVVHCSAGYRSAAGSSILENEIKTPGKVFDLGAGVKSFLR